MARSVNKTILIGNIGGEPKIHNFKNGGRVLNFSLATNEQWKSKDGEQQSHTEWHQIAVYGDQLIDIVWKRCHKGDCVYVEGKTRTRRFEDRDGNPREKAEVILQGLNAVLVHLGDNAENVTSSSQVTKPQKTPDHEVTPEDDVSGL